MGNKFIVIEDDNGGSPINLPVVPINPNFWQALRLTIPSTTDQNLITDAQLASLNAVIAQTSVESLLSSVAAVNLNTATATTLFTVPAGKSCVITRVVLRNASTSLTTVSMAFGFTSPTFNDTIATATHTELTGNTLYTVLSPKVGSLIGVAAANFSELNTILQGAAATCTIDVFGYLF